MAWTSSSASTVPCCAVHLEYPRHDVGLAGTAAARAQDWWLTHDEADRLIAAAAPHLQMLIRFALATGCRAREITGLEWIGWT